MGLSVAWWLSYFQTPCQNLPVLESVNHKHIRGRVNAHPPPLAAQQASETRRGKLACLHFSYKMLLLQLPQLKLFLSNKDFSFINQILTQPGVWNPSLALADLKQLSPCLLGLAPPGQVFYLWALPDASLSSSCSRFCCLLHSWHPLTLSQLVTKIKPNSQPLREKQMKVSCPFSQRNASFPPWSKHCCRVKLRTYSCFHRK